MNVSDIVQSGFLFIWIEKEWLRKIIAITAKWGFKYVENFCWIKKSLNNQFKRDEYTYFNKSKLSLLIFRKGGDVELRHQRNADCIFEYVKEQSPGNDKGKIRKLFFYKSIYILDDVLESKPLFMYHVIETLLPHAVYKSEMNPDNDKLLEL